MSDDPLNNIFDLASRRPLKSEQELRESLGFDATEDGVGLAFAEKHSDTLRFCHHAQNWYVWTGTYWKMEQTKLAFDWARELCRDIARTADEADRPKIARAGFAAAVERFAQSDRAFAVTADTWDRNPWLLGTPDGTIDLQTGDVKAPDRADQITRVTSVSPAPPGTPHPLWSKFLSQATGGDLEFQRFLQRLTGYILTGRVTEEILAFIYGVGGTGKGTFLRAIVAILKDYCVNVPIEVFTAGSKINLEYYRAQMAGTRLVTASETEQGATWAESQLKEMTGNEAPLSARHPYGKPFTFYPQCKIVLVGNHAPKLKCRSEAMERRLRISPFKHKPTKPDHGLKEALEAEHPAILRWMIEGCLLWQQQGLGTCAAVKAATGNYMEQQDAFGRWLAERCITGDTVSERPGKLLADYTAWAKASNETSLTSGDFRESIERTAGLRYATNKGLQWVRGVGLLPSEDHHDRYGDHDR